MVTLEKAKTLAEGRLRKKRYRHVENVANEAEKLALRYGADVYKARLAAWLHDIEKESSRDELLQLLRQDAIMASATEHRPLPIWHGPCAAIYAKQELGIDDEEVLSAVACHTTGKVNMSLLDKIIFLADVISAERTFPTVARLRKMAYEDLDKAVLAAMGENIAHVKASNKTLDEETYKAYNFLQKQGKENTQQAEALEEKPFESI